MLKVYHDGDRQCHLKSNTYRNTSLSNYDIDNQQLFIVLIIVFCLTTGPSLQTHESRQVFHRKLRNQGCSFTRDWVGATFAFRTPLLSLSLASQQIWKDPRGINVEVRRVDLANWALRTSPKFATEVKYQFYQFFFTRSEIRKSQSPFDSLLTFNRRVSSHPIPRPGHIGHELRMSDFFLLLKLHSFDPDMPEIQH